jgi:nitroreductase
VNGDEFLEIVKKRRSIRAFDSKPVSDEDVQKVLEAGRWAMCGANTQPWEYIVVRDKAVIKQIADAKKLAYSEKYELEQTKLEELRVIQCRSFEKEPGFVDAPVLIVVCGDRRTFQATCLTAHFIIGEGGLSASYLKNMANTTQLMNLEAAALGIGSEWISVGKLWETEIRKILDIPEVIDVHTMVALGYPSYTPKPVWKRPLKDMVHYEKYDRSKYRTAEDIHKFLFELRRKSTTGYINLTDDGEK